MCVVNSGKYNVKVRTATTYTENWLDIDRPQPLTDKKIETLIQQVMQNDFSKDVTDKVYSDFIEKCEAWIQLMPQNNLAGFDAFARKDICIGCTQFIDNQYMQGKVQTLVGDYKYHQRLGNTPVTIDTLESNVPLLLALPFPSTGDIINNIDKLLDICYNKNIPVHIDGAWITCSRNINFNFNHPAIHSFAISLSKGLGLGWNRIGIRWSRETTDSISIMNDFNMNNRVLAMVGLHFLKNTNPGHLWNVHKDNYSKICKDFNLEETNSIHIARKNGQPVGVSPLLRYLEK